MPFNIPDEWGAPHRLLGRLSRQGLWEFIIPEGVDHFTSEACWDFAVMLHALTGWPLAILNGYPHGGVIAPDRRFVDAVGAWETQRLKRWLQIRGKRPLEYLVLTPEAFQYENEVYSDEILAAFDLWYSSMRDRHLAHSAVRGQSRAKLETRLRDWMEAHLVERV